MHSEVLHQSPRHLGLAPHHGGLVSQHHAAAGGRYRAGRGHGQRRLGNRNPEDMEDRSYELLIKLWNLTPYYSFPPLSLM